MQKHKVISSDDHIYEPLDLWTTRLDKEFRDRAPRVIPEEGDDWWYCEGIKIQTAAAGAQAGLRFEDPDRLSFKDKVENIRLGRLHPRGAYQRHGCRRHRHGPRVSHRRAATLPADSG